MRNCNGFFDQFDSAPVWTMDNKFFICTDVKNGKELQRVPRPLDSNGRLIDVFTPFQAWTSVGLIIDSQCVKEVYAQTKSTKTASKRLLPAGSELTIEINPSGGVWTKGWSVRLDHPGQDIWSGNLPITLFSMTPPVALPQPTKIAPPRLRK